MNQTNAKTLKGNSPQYTKIISIDPSTTCSGLCVEGKLYAVAQHDLAFTKSEKMKKWFSIADEECNIVTYPKRNVADTYSGEEVSKLKYYQNIRDTIMDIIGQSGTFPKQTMVLMEGFSYSSASGHLIDLVTLSTLIRTALVELGFNLQIVAPSDLKACTAKLSYDAVDIGKKKEKLEWRNSNGVSGGSFKKHDMYQAILDSTNTGSNWKRLLADNAKEISSMKSVPKPIEDVNDAFLLYKIYENGLI